MAEDWRTAFFLQAHSDYLVFRLLYDPATQTAPVPACHLLHYLQMTTEKLAKGFLTPPGGPRPPAVHQAFVRFLRSARGNQRLQRECRCGPQQFGAYVNSLLPLAETIQNLAPAGDRDRANPEYPWPEADRVIAPAEFSFPDLDFRSPKMIKLLPFLEACFRSVDM